MLQNKTIAVLVPAYNEESQIKFVIDGLPDFVDKIIVVNDCSTDNTAKVVESIIPSQVAKGIITKAIPIKQDSPYDMAEQIIEEIRKKEDKCLPESKTYNSSPEDDRLILINHIKNQGKGAAVATGYKWCKDHNIDCTAIMDGDGQMDPSELIHICTPIVNEVSDYVKGNRLLHKSARYLIPKIRFFGNSTLSILTKIASGYWKISDTQTGYTAISLEALNKIDIHKIFPDYGAENDILVKLNIANCSIKEIPIKPVYNIGEQSKMKIWKIIPKISFLLLRLFFNRLWNKYLYRDFHPLFLLYHFAFLMALLSIPYGIKILKGFIYHYTVEYGPILAFMFIGGTGFQSFLFAMWMDIQDNDRLIK